jgi:hypothetical protein
LRLGAEHVDDEEGELSLVGNRVEGKDCNFEEELGWKQVVPELGPVLSLFFFLLIWISWNVGLDSLLELHEFDVVLLGALIIEPVCVKPRLDEESYKGQHRRQRNN